MSRIEYNFNNINNYNSWNFNAYKIISISGDDLILKVSNKANNIINDGNIIPMISENYDLGNQKNKFKNIFSKTITGNLNGNAKTCTKLNNPVKIGNILFNGEVDINLPGVNERGNQDTTGNSASASKLKKTIQIGGIPFDGSKSIDLPGVNILGKVGTYGIAYNAIKLYFKPKIGGILFDGSNNIDLPGVNIPGNQNTTGESNSSKKSESLQSVNNNSKILLNNNTIEYIATQHNFNGLINSPEINKLKNELEILKKEMEELKKSLN
tara:strand:+ start:4578 stop:5381 length:804 start_codon:yes stop_codon:yes gene_type:complete